MILLYNIEKTSIRLYPKFILNKNLFDDKNIDKGERKYYEQIISK